VLGADENTSAQIAATTVGTGESKKETEMEFADWVAAQGFTLSELTEKQSTGLKTLYEQTKAPPAPPVTATPLASPPPTPQPDPVVDMRGRLAAEHRRIDFIVRACGEEYGEIKCKAISEGWDETRTELEILRASRPKGPAPHTGNDGIRSAQAIEA